MKYRFKIYEHQFGLRWYMEDWYWYLDRWGVCVVAPGTATRLFRRANPSPGAFRYELERRNNE